MDFLSLENALLLQGGTPYFGYGWSDPSSSGNAADDGTVDGSIYGPSNGVNSRGVGLGCDYYSHGVGYGSDNHVAKLQTPLDPLLKELKREHASSAGPQDVLASLISKEELEFLFKTASLRTSTTKSTDGSGGKKFRIDAPSDVPEGVTSTKKETMDKESTDLFDIARAETPLARGGQSFSKTQLDGSSPNVHPASLASSKLGIHQNMSHKRPFLSHVDNLLQTTPHLRHLTAASTDLSGSGHYDDSKNIFSQMLSFKSKDRKISSADNIDSSSAPGNVDYPTSILRQRANRRASLELASFMRLLSNEMPQEAFVVVETEVYKRVFSLMQSKAARSDDRLAGVAAVDALLSVPSSNEETKAIRVGNALSNGLKAPHADYEFLHAVARAIGRMAFGSTNVDLVEFEITRSLEWLQSDRSDRKLAAVLVLSELAKSSPTAFYSKTNTSSTLSGGRGGSMGVLASYLDGLGLSGTNEFLDNIFPVLMDPHPIVRVSAADALSECLKILMDRQQRSMTAPLCKLHSQMMDGLQWTPGGKVNDGEDKFKERDNAIKAHGSLLVVTEMLNHSRNFILPRFDEVCTAVLKFTRHPMALIRLELIRIIPQLARRNPDVFGCRYLCQSLDFLLASAATPPPQRSGIDLRPKAFLAIGQLASGMSDEEMGGGDITIPTVRIFDKPKSVVEAEDVDEDDSEYHIVELEDESVFQQRLGDIFNLISESLKRNRLASLGNVANYRSDVLICFANMVEALGQHATPYVRGIVEDMFRSGLSKNLLGCLHSIAASLPSMQLYIERRLFEEVSFCLAGTRSLNSAYDLFSASENIRPAMPSINEGTSALLRSTSSPREQGTENNLMRSMSLASMNPSGRPRKRITSELEVNELSSSRPRSESITQSPAAAGASTNYESGVVINTSTKPEAIDKLILSLQTLRTIGESYMRAHETENGNMLLPFLRDVISLYLDHPSSDVRREAAVTCSLLLLPFGKKVKEGSILSFRVGSVSGSYVEEILQKLLRIAVSDLSPVVRLCVVSGLDERYDPYLSQLSLLPPLFLMLEDETLVMRACALQLLGRLSRLNPATILPGLRIVLTDLILELQCGGDGGGKEAATRLIIVFLREEALQQLVRPFISSIIDSLPLSDDVPRLVSASLEALGELANVAHGSIKPWLRQLIPHILSNVEDQNSSKQKVSLWALGKIAFGTNYVISPYLDYPKLLSQASGILPTTKRANWELRREVFRTFGVLGALDPDRFGSSSTRKGGGKGGGYFVELEEDKDVGSRALNPAHGSEIPKMGEWSQLNNQALSDSPQPNVDSDLLPPSNESSKKVYKDSDNDEPAHLYMYEQYAMTAQPLSKLPPARRLSPSDDDFYPTVAVQALMRILRDSSLSNLHGMVMKAVMFIFNALGLRSVPFLKNIVPHILSTIKVCGQHGLREVLLQQVANLSAIVREHLRPYLPAIFDVVEEFWFTRHLSALCSLVKRVAIAVPDDFNTYVPLLVRQILATIDSTDFSEHTFGEQAERLDLILQLIQGIKGVLGEYIHLVVPALVKLTDLLIDPDPDKNLVQISPPLGSARSNVAVETVETLSVLLETMEMNEGRFAETIVKSSTTLPARVVQPFLRMLGGDVKPNKAVGSAMIDCLCICVRQLGSNRWLSFYHNSTLAVISSWQSKVGIESGTQHEGNEVEPRVTAHHQPRPIDIYKDVVVELVSSANRMRWANNSDEGSVSAGLSLENPRASEASLTGLGEALKPNTARNPSTIQVQNQIAAHQTNISNLQRAWDVSQRSSREDWDEWLRRFSVQLLREAPSPALRACAELAQAYQPLARELFSAAFACCWVELDDHYRSSLIFSMETVFQADASQISLEILQLLLNLAEFLEQNKKTELPIDISIIAELALKCRAYARALHYKEREYIMGRGGSCVEQLIDINKKLDLPEAALGVLQAAKIEIQRHNRAGDRDNSMAYSVLNTIDGDKGSWAGDIMYESWLAKLGSWGEALQLYEQKLRENPNDVNSILGCMQCYEARGDWEKALDLAGRSWGALSGEPTKTGGNSRRSRRSRRRINEENHKLALKHCAQAAWRLGKWDELETFSSQLVQGQHNSSSPTVSFDLTSSSKGYRTSGLPTLDYDSAFYRAVINIHREEWDEAAISIDAARKAMDSRFTALLAESYKRAYPSMVAAQTLSELEEIVSFRQFELRAKLRLHTTGPLETKKARQHLTNVWRRRLDGCRVDAEVHSEILAVRSLVLGPADEVDATITLSALSRQAEAYQLAERTLLDPLAQMKVSLNSPIFGIGTPSDLKIGLVINPGESAESLVNKDVVRIRSGPVYEQYCQQLFTEAGGEEILFVQHKLYFAYIKHLWATERRDEAMTRLSLLCNIVDLTTHCGETKTSNELRIKCWLRYGDWKLALNPPGSDLPDSLATDVLVAYKRATDVAVSDNYRAFHSWALINFRLAEQLNDKDRGTTSPSKPSSIIQHHVIAAVKGFVRAISVGTKRWSASVQQDLLNLLSCLFKYGELDDVSRTINEGLESIEIEAWLGVLPQLLARIHIKSPSVRSVLHPLLVRLGTKHPQAMMYPLSVLLKSPVTDRKVAAESLMNSLKAHSNALIEESLMVSSELIRVAILW
jgi:tetratricopeptide (TPR) repeat protein